jgi:hypothetical protein
LDRVKDNDEVTPRIQYNFNSNLALEKLDYWKDELKGILNKWFIDKHLSSNYIRETSIKHINKMDDWTDEHRSNYMRQSEANERIANERIMKNQIATQTFIDMIEVFLGIDISVYRLDLSKVNVNEYAYPYSMNIHWGFEYELIYFKNLEKKYLLHFGKILD